LLPTRSENTLVVADILTHMNGIVDSDPKNRYIIVGATNRIECIDAAIKRSGRFGKHMRFEKPNVKERAEFLTKRLAGLALNPNDFDIDRLAEETEGKTFEDLANAIRSAMRKVQTSSTPFNQELLEKFIDTDVRGIIESEHSIDPMQQRVVAVHLAGHVLAYELLNARERVSRVTTHSIQMGVKERMQWQATMETTKQEPLVRGGIFTYTPQGTLAAKSMVDMINEAKIHLAGHMAETILMGTTYDYHAGHNGEVNDRNTAYAIALNLATGQVDMAQLSETQQNKLRDSAFEIMHKWEQEVSILLAENKVALTKLADALTERHTLSNKEINELVNSPSDRTISDERADELLAELLNTKPLLKKATA
jgi:ATP-dependent Zn protease